eukprot:TRINITY_DN4874_c2_g1_i1.p1 TRINITY_DN4874_c2_g1~~TRINITY_DN4874_c2_g1_i1.p1  ORF type:complete len:379 (+),score=37.95 TRINITY_DN4874_c2_g1_i1:157-1137(+)
MVGQLFVVEEVVTCGNSSQAVLLIKQPNNELVGLPFESSNSSDDSQQEQVLSSLVQGTYDFGRNFDSQSLSNISSSFVSKFFGGGSDLIGLFSLLDSGSSALLRLNRGFSKKYYEQEIDRSILEDVVLRCKNKSQTEMGQLIVVEVGSLLRLNQGGYNSLRTLNGQLVQQSEDKEGISVNASVLSTLRSVASSGVQQTDTKGGASDSVTKSKLNVSAASFEVSNSTAAPSQVRQQQSTPSIPAHKFDVEAVTANEQIAPVFQELLNLQTELYNQDFYSMDLRLKAVMHSLVVACQNTDSFEWLNDMVNVFMDEYAEQQAQQWEQEG